MPDRVWPVVWIPAFATPETSSRALEARLVTGARAFDAPPETAEATALIGLVTSHYTVCPRGNCPDGYTGDGITYEIEQTHTVLFLSYAYKKIKI